MNWPRVVAIAAIAVLLASCASEEPEPKPEQQPEPQQAPEMPTHVGAAACAHCHRDEHDAWRGSHHDLAMQDATPATVLGDFDDTSFSYAGIETTFAQRDGRFFVRTDGPDGELTEYEIAYTYGVEPLQQYLVRFPDGRIQALPVCWDTRPAEAGGQRWFHIYPDEQIDHRDILHWTGPLQNWNFMCAECHSTKVRKNYDLAADTFATTWAEIDVACEACHGPGSKHVAWAEDIARTYDDNGLVSLSDTGDAAWIMEEAIGIAQRSSPRQSRDQLETCARCHARRAILSEDYVHGQPLLDTHRVALLTDGLYHADGQILDEVYVYGSFLQSRMHRAGVTCSDCHEPHSLDLKAPGNGVCGQCHLAERFDTPEHHRHAADAQAAQCVSCHMPSRNYMVVDARRDHSFRVPRPDLSVTIGTPNACNGCHDDQPAQWAAERVVEWFGAERRPHYGEILEAGRRGAAGATEQLARLAEDPQSPAIVRATAVSLLAGVASPSAAGAIGRAAQADDPLLRMAAADAARALEPQSRRRIAGPLLSDEMLSVRLAAAGTLMSVPADSLTAGYAAALEKALDEYRDVQVLNADRAESHVNLGLLLASRRDLRGAVDEYRKAIGIMPSFVPPYANMADLYREGGQEDAAETILRRGLAAAPDSAELTHALGLSLVRQQRYDEALQQLGRAAELAPDNTRYAYVLGIALNSTGATGEGLAVLRAAHERRPADRDVLAALATISRDSGDMAQTAEYAAKLLELDPQDPVGLQLLQQVQAEPGAN